jgi:hypothetical protein
MEPTVFLAKPYAVVTEDGVVVDRVLLSDSAYESLDLSQAFPGCALEVDEGNLLSIGHGAPKPDFSPEQIAASPPLEVVMRSLTSPQREAIRAALEAAERPDGSDADGSPDNE